MPLTTVIVVGVHPFDVLACDQRQQRHSLTCRRRRIRALGIGSAHRGHDRQRVADQGIDQLLAGSLVVPGDIGFSGRGVVGGGAQPRHHVRATRDNRGDPADGGDQLGDGVLGGDRVVEDGRIQRPAGPPLQNPGIGDDLFDSVEDAVRVLRGGQPPAPIGKHRRMKRRPVDRESARRFPPQVERHRLGGGPVREPVQGLQHQHRGNDLRRDGRPSTGRGEQIGEHLRREQLQPVLGKKREHRARRQEMPGHR